jgi:tetratricopeptide (TPR) repeat protein
VSDEARGERQSADNRHLLPYGVGGDYVGARRTRRAFRLLVFACVGFTFSLYFVEKYLRYERTEVQYRMALTLEDDSQRAILRHVVRSDAKKRDVPTAKYVEALAYIEEDDLVLERFVEAVKLAPDKGSLLVMYGCKLFQLQRYTEARQILREATLKSSRNALPKYLQAAAIAASSETEDDFRTALALVSRANDSGESVLFPQPLWHETLPKRGNWYEMLKRQLADDACAPLYHLRNAVIKRATTALDEGDFQTWDGWLLQLQKMGERLVGEQSSDGTSPGTSPAICGLQIQKDALAMRITLRDRRGGGGVPREELAERAAVVNTAIARVLAFEAERETLVAEAEGHVVRPLWLAVNGLMLLGLAVCMGWLLSKAIRTDKNARTLRQSRSALRILLAWIAIMAILLFLSGLLKISGFQTAINAAWYLLLGAMMLFALLWPLSVLPPVEQLCQPFVSEADYTDRLREARRRRRKAYCSLSSRYLNILLGSYVLMLSAYFIGFRILTGLYPTDIKLLTTGMELREIVLFNDLYQML